MTTWDNPLVGQNASAQAEAGSSSAVAAAAAGKEADDKEAEDDESEGPGNNDGADPSLRKKATANGDSSNTATAPKAATPSEPTAADYGGIDPELAYLDPSLGARKGQTASGSYAARFNARTGRFEGDPRKNPDRVGDV